MLLIGCLQAVEVIKVLLSRTVMEDISREGAVNNPELRTAEKSELYEESSTKRSKINVDRNPQEIEDRDEVEQYEIKPKKKSVFTPLVGRQILYDASAGEFHTFSLPPKNPSCKVCGVDPSIRCMSDSEDNLKVNSKRILEVFILFVYLSCIYI